jgi:cytochrome c oxidase subunit 2
VRRKQLVVAALLVLAVALATAGVAAAANGGFTPQYAHSPNTHRTNTVYYVVLGFTSAIFLIVEAALVLFIVKYRSRGRTRTVEGAQVHGNTRLELLWTVIPVLILAVIAAIVFVELPGIANAPASAASTLKIRVEGHQFYWQFDYPNGARSINDLHVPVDQDVDLEVVSADVLHSWWIPQLAGKLQAVPGRTNHTWFRADKTGTFYGYCALICGPYHAKMRLRVLVVSQADYQSFVGTQAAQSLGKSEFEGVCATCHGLQGEGGYGPALSSSSILTQRASLESIVRNGRNLMPPVADSWTDAQIDALAAYAKSHIYKGAGTGGG